MNTVWDLCPICGARCRWNEDKTQAEPLTPHRPDCEFAPDKPWKYGYVYFSDSPEPITWDMPSPQTGEE